MTTEPNHNAPITGQRTYVQRVLHLVRVHHRKIAMGIVLSMMILSISPYHAINNPNEGVRVAMVKSLVDHQEWAIDKVLNEWGYINDRAIREGKNYSSKAPLTSMIGALTYGVYRTLGGEPLGREALSRLCRMTVLAPVTLYIFFLLAGFLRRRLKDPYIADVATFSLFVGSPLLAYVHVFSGHTITALACLASYILLADRERFTERRRFIEAGFWAVFAVCTEYPAALVVLPLWLYGLWENRHVAVRYLYLPVIGSIVPLGVTMVAHHYMFGAAWKTGYSFLQNRSFEELHSEGFFGISAPKFDVLGTVLFSGGIGLYFYTPLFLVGSLWLVYGLIIKRGAFSRASHLTMLVAVAFMLMFIAGHKGWRGGWVVGPRYITEVMPFLCLMAAAAMDRFGEQHRYLARAGMVCLVAVGILHSTFASLYFPHIPDRIGNPVYETILPLVFQGYAPENLMFLLGGGRSIGFAWVMLGVTLVLVLPMVMHGRDCIRPTVLGISLCLTLATFLGPNIPSTTKDVAGTQSRRLYGYWRPLEGSPVFQGREKDKIGPRMLMSVGWTQSAQKKIGEVCQ